MQLRLDLELPVAYANIDGRGRRGGGGGGGGVDEWNDQQLVRVRAPLEQPHAFQVAAGTHLQKW